MSYIREVTLGSSFQPFTTFREQFGFVPKLFRAQTLLPRVIEAEGALISAMVWVTMRAGFSLPSSTSGISGVM